MKVKIGTNYIYVATGGTVNGNQPTIVLIHGAGMDHSAWTETARQLRNQGFSVIAPDLIGHGRSEGKQDNSVQDYARMIDRLCQKLHLPQVILVGHSMGGLVALEASSRLRGQVSQLVLLGCAEKMPVHSKLLEAAKAKDPKAVRMILSWSFAHQMAQHNRTAISNAVNGILEDPSELKPGLTLIPGARSLLDHCEKGGLYQDLKACDAYSEARLQADKLDIPCLILNGSMDRMILSQKATKLAESPMVGIRTLPHVGHMSPIEAPELLIHNISKFIHPEKSKAILG